MHLPSMHGPDIMEPKVAKFDLPEVLPPVVLDNYEYLVLHFINIENTTKYPYFIFKYSKTSWNRHCFDSVYYLLLQYIFEKIIFIKNYRFSFDLFC